MHISAITSPNFLLIALPIAVIYTIYLIDKYKNKSRDNKHNY